MKNGLFLLLFLLGAMGALAQMQSGEQMKDYDTTFGVTVGKASYPYDVTLLENKTSVSNVLTSGQQPVLRFLVTNNTNQPLRGPARIDMMRYGTRGITGDLWLPQIFKYEDLPPQPISLDVPAKGSQVIEVSSTLPETLGAYAFVFDLGEAGRRFALSVVRTFAPEPKKIQYPTLSLDAPTGIPMLRSLGIQAIRQEVTLIASDDPNHDAKMAELGTKLRELVASNITVLLTLSAGPGLDLAKQPLHRVRPFLDDDGNLIPGRGDIAGPPSIDADFQKFVADLCRDYGWPKGPVTAVELWNEPWEGVSISGWGADSIRYRELFTAMAQGVEAARKDGADVLITGCASSTNSWDKLFADGKDDYLKWFDAVTLHYQGLWSPALYRLWRNRTGPHGRVRIWDTESWVANSEDRIAALIAGDRAAGYDRAMGVFYGNVSHVETSRVKMPDGATRQVETIFPWPPAAGVAAAQHFLGQREFRRLLFPNGLPWVMVFDGDNGQAEDGTIVVVGDLREVFTPTALLFRQVKGLAQQQAEPRREALRKQIAALPAGPSRERTTLEGQLKGLDVLSGGSLTVENPDGEFTLYDFCGNAVPSRDGKIVVPLGSHGYFLRGNGKPGAFARLEGTVARGRIEGYEPVQIVAHDFTAPLAAKPPTRFTLTNVLNRPVSGALRVALAGTELAPVKLDLAPNETREVLVPATLTARLDNTYALAATFDAGADGSVALKENLHVNVIVKRRIAVDGKLDDWRDVPPQPVQAGGDAQGLSQAVAAWLPFEKFDAKQEPGHATGYLAYDDQNLYFAAKIADRTPSPGTIRFATRSSDEDFYPELSFDYDMKKLSWKKEVTWNESARAAGALLRPGSTTERNFTAWVPYLKRPQSSFALDLDLPAGAYHLVSFYFVDWDTEKSQATGADFGNADGRRVVVIQAQNAATGQNLGQPVKVHRYGGGCYATFLLAGKVRMLFRSGSELGASLSGLFFDPVAPGLPPPTPGAPAAADSISTLDTATRGDWPGRYGRDGYEVFGSEPKYPDYAKVTVVESHEKTQYRWPEGVRRYTYRRNPDLPFGSFPNFDNVQIGFNVIPRDQKEDLLPNLPGVMPGFIPYRDTDYEYALNQVDAAHGGGTEIWRSRVPGMPPKNFYPRQPASPYDGAVNGGQLAITQDGTTRVVEAAIPWSEIPLVKKALEAKRTIKFTFRVNDDQGPAMELPEGRSVSKENPYALHPDFVTHWANEVEFALEP